jgi:hypothetical protein
MFAGMYPPDYLVRIVSENDRAYGEIYSWGSPAPTRTALLPPNDSLGLTLLNCERIEQKDWVVCRLHPPDGDHWQDVVDGLRRHHVFTMPDPRALQSNGPREVTFDGSWLVVEYLTGHLYRTYDTGQPRPHPWPQAKDVHAITDQLLRLVPAFNEPTRWRTVPGG